MGGAEVVFEVEKARVRRIRVVLPVLPLLLFDMLPAEFDRSDVRRLLVGTPQYSVEKNNVALRRRIDRIMRALVDLGLAVKIPGKRSYRKAYASLKSWAEGYLGRLIWREIKSQLEVKRK